MPCGPLLLVVYPSQAMHPEVDVALNYLSLSPLVRSAGLSLVGQYLHDVDGDDCWISVTR